MLKTLILSLILSSSLLAGGQISHAQTVDTPATTAQVDALQQTLITLLTQLIAQLQEQIATLIAQQATQATQLGAVSQKVDSVVVQTAPAPVVVPPAPVAPTLKVGTAYCASEEAYLPITVEGKNWSNATFHLQPQTDTGKIFYGNPDAQTGGRSWMGTHPENTNLELGYHPDDAGPATVVVSLDAGLRLTAQVSLPPCQ